MVVGMGARGSEPVARSVERGLLLSFGGVSNVAEVLGGVTSVALREGSGSVNEVNERVVASEWLGSVSVQVSAGVQRGL